MRALQAYVSYKVVARNRRQGSRSEVIRRFRDFVWLQQRLRSQYRGRSCSITPEIVVLGKLLPGCSRSLACTSRVTDWPSSKEEPNRNV